MHARIEATANTAKDGRFSMTRASRPRMPRRVTFCPLLGGGVCGNVRLNRLITTEAPAASRNGTVEVSTPMRPMVTPIAIHPNVPNTRIRGKSRPVSFKCCRVNELVSAMVGK